MIPLRLAVVGGGALGKHHVRILSGFDDVQLVAVAELNEAAGRDLADRHHTRWVGDYRDLLSEVDAAVIAVPTFAHYQVATDFLDRGIPLLIEKPLAANLDQAQALVDLAERRGAMLQVGHVERFNPALSTAQQYIADPKYISSERVSPYAFRSTDIGVVHDMMIHDLDLVLSFVDSPPCHVEAFGVSILGSHEDSVQARIKFENGCIADLSASRVSPVTRRHMRVWSALGCTTIDMGGREVTHYAPSDMLKYGTSPLERAQQPGANIDQLKSEIFGSFIKVQQPAVVANDALTEELSAFVACVRMGQRPLVSGEDGLAAMSLADRILRCVAEHQWDGHALGAVGPHARFSSRRKLAG